MMMHRVQFSGAVCAFALGNKPWVRCVCFFGTNKQSQLVMCYNTWELENNPKYLTEFMLLILSLALRAWQIPECLCYSHRKLWAHAKRIYTLEHKPTEGGPLSVYLGYLLLLFLSSRKMKRGKKSNR